MAIIDFHSHILPGIDDGSKNPETSKKMLLESANQGTDIIVATPHFYADEERIDNFLEKRRKAYESLQTMYTEDFPKILLGAEVAYFPGICNSEHINKLFIEGTDILLLEMPFGAWTKAEFNETKKLILESDYRIMLAHLERFMLVSANKKYIRELMRLPVIIQFNSENLSIRKTKKKIIKAMKTGYTCVLGSDCHDMEHRKPDLKAGRDIIEKKLGKEALDVLDAQGEHLLTT